MNAVFRISAVLIFLLVATCCRAQRLTLRSGDSVMTTSEFTFHLRKDFFHGDSLEISIDSREEGELVLMLIPVRGNTRYERTGSKALLLRSVSGTRVHGAVSPGAKLITTWNRPGRPSVHFRGFVTE